MREHGYDDVLVESVSDDTAVTFPLRDDPDEEPKIDLDAITFERCPHCHEVISFPGFDTIFAFVSRSVAALDRHLRDLQKGGFER